VNHRLVPLVLVATLAGCTKAPPLCILPPVAVTPIALPTLIAPAPGATSVPAAAGLTIQISRQDTPDELIHVHGDDGSDIISGPLAAAPTAQFPNAVSATVPALNAHTRYSISVLGTTPVLSSACGHSGGPYQVSIFGGTFTTQ
jgi:hypothetical protein